MTARREFGHTWWGQAWIDALERQAQLGANRLPRGRTYARKGQVFLLTVEPGSIRADVKGSRPEPYEVELAVRTFTDDEWRKVFDVIVAKVQHTAALLDGELHPDLVEDAAQAGVNLLPQAGEVIPKCSCPDWAEPCKHAAAVCYLAADELDADPFALLYLRGRTRQQILTAVRQLRTAPTSAAEHDGRTSVAGNLDRPQRRVDEGVRAAEAWTRSPKPLPSVPLLPEHPARPAAQSVDPPADATFTATGLQALAADAATRAWTALAEQAPLYLGLSVEDDAVRWAASASDSDDLPMVAKRLGTSARTLARKAAAWELGGRAGLAMLEERKWRADPLVMSAARLAVEEVVRGHVRGEIDGNRLTLGDVQLRLSRTGEWWSFKKRSSSWEPIAGPAEDADALIEPKPFSRR